MKMEPPSVKDELKDLILNSLRAKYVSKSSKDGIRTGNHYQSVTLGETQTSGFRTNRSQFLDQIDFKGKKVLDLGSNLGEISRAARARGACLVDGFEYDPFFIEIANLINAYSGVTRVSFYRRDITDPSIYGEHYDIVLAFSVFTYVRSVLHKIAESTEQMLVLETHKVNGGLESNYLTPISRYFPYHKILGESDWGTRLDAQERRIIVVFARQESTLATFEAPLSRSPSATKGLTTVTGPAPKDISLVTDSLPSAPETPQFFDIDINKTPLYQKFFSKFQFDSLHELLNAVDGMPVDLEALVKSDDWKSGLGGWVYWLLFLKGYLQYTKAGTIGPDNIYYNYMVTYFNQQGHDPAMYSYWTDPQIATKRVELRFRDLHFFHNQVSGNATDSYNMAPLKIIVSDPPPPGALLIYQVGSDTPLQARRLDGWHRLFSARLCGIQKLPGQVISEDRQLKHVMGAIERFSFDGRKLMIRGWSIKPDQAVQIVDVRLDGKKVAVAGITLRPDIKLSFEKIPHAHRSGFVVDCDTHLPKDKFLCFNLLPLSAGLPVGKIVACYLPGMFEQRNWPPEPLAQRLLNESDSVQLAFRSVKCLYEMITPLKEHQPLDTFTSVLDWGVGCGLLQFFLPRFLPSAKVIGVDMDKEAVKWCQQSGLAGKFIAINPMPPIDLRSNSFDLVLGYSILTRLRPDAQLAWLGELRRVVKPGGYLALTVNGELMRPFLSSPKVLGDFEASGIAMDRPWRRQLGGVREAEDSWETYQTKAYTLREYSKWFEVVNYIEGGVNDQQDLVILRKRGLTNSSSLKPTR
jgi:SAM-dependent methyltransferase